jgi:hypothetical protein
MSATRSALCRPAALNRQDSDGEYRRHNPRMVKPFGPGAPLPNACRLSR